MTEGQKRGPYQKGPLTDRQKRAAQEYLVDNNWHAAIRRAGYASTSMADRLKNDDRIQEYLKILREDAQTRTEITIDKVLRELWAVASADIRKAVSWGSGDAIIDAQTGEVSSEHAAPQVISSEQIDDATAAAISEIVQTRDGIKIKMHDKISALDKIAKHLGMYDEQVRRLGAATEGQKDVEEIRYKVIDPKANGHDAKGEPKQITAE